MSHTAAMALIWSANRRKEIFLAAHAVILLSDKVAQRSW